MDKVVFLLTRKAGLARREFFDHYQQVHSLLGLRLCVLMEGYALNFTEGEGPDFPGPDSITQVWTGDAEAFLDPARAFASEAARDELMADDRSFIGPSFAYVVEEQLLHGSWPAGELRTRTPGVKRISLHPGGAIPPVAGGVERVVVDRVRRALLPGSPQVGFFLSEWAPSRDALPRCDAPGFSVSEYPQRHPKR